MRLRQKKKMRWAPTLSIAYALPIYDEDYMTREEARESMGISGSEFDSNIYKRLRFPDAM